MQSARHGTRGAEDDPHTALLPWIPPRLPPQLVGLIERLGVVRQLAAGEFIFAEHERVERVVLVRRGLTARTVFDPCSDKPGAMAISPAWRLAAGNLNFLSQHPCSGRYFAICRSEIVSCSQSVLLALSDKDPQLMRQLMLYFELCSLSNRLTWAAVTLLPVSQRLTAFLLAWAGSFGEEAQRHDRPGPWLRMPTTPARTQLASAISASLMTVDRLLYEWRQCDLLLRERETLWLRPELLDEAHAWLVRLEEGDINHRRSPNLTDMLR